MTSPVNDGIVGGLLWLSGAHWTEHWISVAEAALGAALPTFVLWLGGWLYWKLRHREGLGLGDVKLMAMVGAFLGLRGALLTLIVGALLGSVVGYACIRIAHKDPASYELPFGTFLGIAAIAVSFAGPLVISWYSSIN